MSTYHKVRSTRVSGLADLVRMPDQGLCAYDSDPEEYEAIASFSNILSPFVDPLPRSACSKAAAMV